MAGTRTTALGRHDIARRAVVAAPALAAGVQGDQQFLTTLTLGDGCVCFGTARDAQKDNEPHADATHATEHTDDMADAPLNALLPVAGMVAGVIDLAGIGFWSFRRCV